MSMKVVIPLAGFGTRMRPHTHLRPKALYTIAGKTVLDHLLESLKGLDISEYIFIVGYLGDQLEKHVRSRYDIKAHFVTQGEMLGQSHAIHLAAPHIDDSPTFVIFGDTLWQADLTFLNQPAPDTDAVIFCKTVEDPRPFGVVMLNEDGLIQRFVEKPSTTDNKLVVVGLYYFAQGTALIKAIETQMERKLMTKNEYFIADAMTLMIEGGGKFRTGEINTWLDTGRPDTVLEAQRWLLENGHATVAAAAPHNTPAEAPSSPANITESVIVPPVYIDPTARISRSVVGPYVSVGAGAKLEGVVVRDSVIEDGATLRNVVLDQSLIGRVAKVENKAATLNIADHTAIGTV